MLDFLTDLANAPVRRAKLAQLRLHEAEFGVDELQPWDIAYYSENRSSTSSASAMSSCMPLFPGNKAVSGLFEVVKRYGIAAKERTDVDMWHRKCASSSCMTNTTSCAAASISTCAREHKRGGVDGRPSARCVNWMVPAEAGRLPDL